MGSSELTLEDEPKEEISEIQPTTKVEGDEEEAEDEPSFEELGLDPRLIRALRKKETSITIPTPIQRVAIPLILEGKDVVAKAKTGSGKTLAYLLPLLQKLLRRAEPMKPAPSALILVPSGELCQQVYKEVMNIVDICKFQMKVVKLNSQMHSADMRGALSATPDIVVSTPACIAKCLSGGVLQASSVNESLEILVLDEADLLLSFGYENDISALQSMISRRCQCLLMSATSSEDVDKLKKLILHNPYILTLPEVEGVKDDIISKNVQQFWISCSASDKLLYTYALIKLELIQKKVLIFTNSVDTSFKLKLFLEKFWIKSAVLNSELPQNSRLHILEEFNAGLFDFLIATDDSESKVKDKKKLAHSSRKSGRRKGQKVDSEFGVVRGIDFKNVHTVLNYDMPASVTGYIHRIGRTGRAHNTGTSVSLVSSDEMEVFGAIKMFVSDSLNVDSEVITPFPLLPSNAVESLRYRAEDTAKSVTKLAIREARAQDVRIELLNSEKLKRHFEANPRDLDLLKHDKLLSKQPPVPHLRHVPEYLQDSAAVEASKMLKLARAAMGNPSARPRHFKRKTKKGGDPLKSLSAGRSKKARSS